MNKYASFDSYRQIAIVAKLVVGFRLAAVLEREKVSREREIESLQQRRCEDMNDMLSQAAEAAEKQRREYEDQLRQLQSELAENHLKHTHQLDQVVLLLLFKRSSSSCTHLRVTGRQLPYGIRQCYPTQLNTLHLTPARKAGT